MTHALGINELPRRARCLIQLSLGSKFLPNNNSVEQFLLQFTGHLQASRKQLPCPRTTTTPTATTATTNPTATAECQPGNVSCNSGNSCHISYHQNTVRHENEAGRGQEVSVVPSDRYAAVLLAGGTGRD